MSSQDGFDDDRRQVGMSNTFAWAIVPVVFVLGTVLASLVVYYRRRRRQQVHDLLAPRAPRTARAAHDTGPEEGLNELGEAPPPYTGKRASAFSEAGDLEAGGRGSPPDYPASPAVPPPAVPPPAVLPAASRTDA
jgi:hypothetical protein